MPYFKRFKAFPRILHGTMAVSFFGSVISGMPLKYADAHWARVFMDLLGGYRTAGFIHRVCAVITFCYFAAHLSSVVYSIAVERKWRFEPFGPESMVPSIRDLRDIRNSFRWFIGRGPRPQFDHWTYWEKFDYWAVFWGVGVIGISGLLLWFPAFFARFLPGWAFNIATIIHSDEALLAAGFIFTIHFFNTHMRPEKFPMDTVIFTGAVDLDELRRERPLEYQRLAENGQLEAHMTTAPSSRLFNWGTGFGFLLIVTGFFLLFLIIIGQFALD